MGTTYDDLLAVARRTGETGFDAFSGPGHHLTAGGDGLPGPADARVALVDLDRRDLVAAGVAPAPTPSPGGPRRRISLLRRHQRSWS
jgi:hypothetical protein